MNTTRTVRKEITALLCGQTTYVLNSRTQYFVETNKAYEVWDVINGLEYRIGRIAKRRVLFVSTDPELLPDDKWIAERAAMLSRKYGD